MSGLLWVIENFFTHPPLDRHDRAAVPMAHHEVGLYLQMTLPAGLRGLESFLGVEAEGTEHEFRLEFRWFGRDEVARTDVRPAALQGRLAGPLREPVESIVQRG